MADRDDVFDVIVIGAGPVGVTTAARAVRGGLSAVVVEERLAGGECEYFACVPSKAPARACTANASHRTCCATPPRCGCWPQALIPA